MAVERRIFVSVNSDASLKHDDRRLGIKHAVLDRLSSAGYQPQLFFEAGLALSMPWTFQNVISVMRRCSGAVILGLRRWRTTADGKPVTFIGEYSHFDGAAALTLGLPTFIAAESDLLNRGIIYTGGGANIVPIPTDATAATLLAGKFGASFDGWIADLKARRDIFLGYCGQSAGFAAQVEVILTRSGATVRNWAMDFGIGGSILEEITRSRMNCDRAIFIFSEDDPLEGKSGQAAPRDNVVFEAGFFMSSTGPRNTIIIRIGNAKMPADLGGAIYLEVPTLSAGPAIIEARLDDFATQGLL
jgi:hypothetical protein